MERGGMHRRIFLGLMSTAASIGLAGCPANQDSESEPDTTTEPATDTSTATDSPSETTARTARSISYTPQAVVTELDGTQRLALHVSGTTTAVEPIQRIHVSVSGTTYSLPDDNGEFSKSGNEGRSVDFAVYVPLEGGNREYWDGSTPLYDIEIHVEETSGESFQQQDRRPAALPPIEPLDHDRLIQAEYSLYWNGKHENWLDRYDVPVEPVLGNYTSRNPEIIHHHLKWCVEHGINWLRIAWQPPNEARNGVDDVLRKHVLEADAAEHIQFSLTHNLPFWLKEDGDNNLTTNLNSGEIRDRLQTDLSYMAEEYFHRPNYLHIDGRPVVTMMNANHYLGDAEAAIDAIADPIDVRPYIIAEIHGTALTTIDFPFIKAADAVTGQPYTSRPAYQDRYVDIVNRTYDTFQLGAAAADVAFIPSTTPGYRDALRASPERYESLSDVARQHMGGQRIARIRAFNPWPELSVIEPYRSMGETFLETTEAQLATGDLPAYTPPQGTEISIVYKDVTRTGDSVVQRNTLLWCKEIAFLDDGGSSIVSYDIGTFDEPYFVFGTLAEPTTPDDNPVRRLGGAFDRTTFLVDGDVSAASTLEIRGSVPDQQPIQVQIEGETVADTTLDTGTTVHHIQLG